MKNIIYIGATIVIANLLMMLLGFWEIIDLDGKVVGKILGTSIIFLLILGVVSWVMIYRKEQKELKDKGLIN